MYQMLPSDDLARFLCHLDSAAIMSCIKCDKPLLNEINIPAFRTNRLILEFPQQAIMVRCPNKLEGLPCTSPQGAPGTDERGHNTTEICDEHHLHFH